ncbi:MAG: hypothetical protein ACR2MG_08125 [Pyrinomonadaceae bacterium]
MATEIIKTLTFDRPSVFNITSSNSVDAGVGVVSVSAGNFIIERTDISMAEIQTWDAKYTGTGIGLGFLPVTMNFGLSSLPSSNNRIFQLPGKRIKSVDDIAGGYIMLQLSGGAGLGGSAALILVGANNALFLGANILPVLLGPTLPFLFLGAAVMTGVQIGSTNPGSVSIARGIIQKPVKQKYFQ